MDSAASSGISIPNSSSKAITSSTVSRLSAPRSSMKEAFSVTLSASTFRCSTTIFFTRSAVSLIGVQNLSLFPSPRVQGARRALPAPAAKDWIVRNIIPPRPPQRINSLFSLSNHGHPAVDMQRLTGDVGGLFTCQINDGGCDFVRFPHASSRNSPEQSCFLIRRKHVGHRCRDETRRHTIHGNIAAGDLGRKRLAHPDDTGFRGGIVALPRVARHPNDRRDLD